MRKTPKMLRALSCAVAVLFVGFVAAPPAFAAPTLNVSQTEGLKDGTVVTISGSGFTPNLKNVAIGQCIEGMKGPSDCNTAGGATFKNVDAQGNIGQFTLVVKEKFGSFDCTTQKCVFGAQPIPGQADAATISANSAFYDLSFGAAAAAPAPTTAPAATTAPASGEQLPKTGPGEELALALGLGLLLLVAGGATLRFVPGQRGGVA